MAGVDALGFTFEDAALWGGSSTGLLGGGLTWAVAFAIKKKQKKVFLFFFN